MGGIVQDPLSFVLTVAGTPTGTEEVSVGFEDLPLPPSSALPAGASRLAWPGWALGEQLPSAVRTSADIFCAF